MHRHHARAREEVYIGPVSAERGAEGRLIRAGAVAPLVVAVALAGGLLASSLVAVRALGERDAAVRAGILSGLGHELEAALREAGPEGAGTALERLLSAHPESLRGAAVSVGDRVVARRGESGPDAAELPAGLGREWRGVVAGSGGGLGPGRPPFRLVLVPVPGLGGAGRLTAFVRAGAAVAAVSLVAFGILSARGLAERARRRAADAERRRLDAVATAGAGLAHRIRNPLAAIKGTAQLLAGQETGRVTERATRIVEASERIEALVAQLLEFARPPETRAERFDLAVLCREVAERADSRVAIRAAGPVPVVADRENVISILEELLSNARAFDPDGVLDVVVSGNGSQPSVEVRDHGPGLSIDARRAFEPYVTTRPDGTGLGLAIARALAQANGGDLVLGPADGGGCAAKLTLRGGG